MDKETFINQTEGRNCWMKYEHNVLKNMRDNLKSINITMSKQKINKEKKLKEIMQNHTALADNI